MKQTPPSSTAAHEWKFFCAGGFEQVRIETSEDLVAIGELDQKLWVALACPVDNVYFDRRTLALVDIDNDGSIRANELVAAVRWAASLLRQRDALVKAHDGLTCSAISADSEEGRALCTALRRALLILGKDEKEEFTVADALELEHALAANTFNGDGIIIESTDATGTHQLLIRDIVKIMGSVIDRSGKPGVDVALIDGFFVRVKQYLDWVEQGNAQDIKPFGEETENAGKNLLALCVKIDDFFTRNALLQFEENARASVNASDAAISVISSSLLTYENEQLAALPLAHVTGDGELSLHEGINPAWQQKMSEFTKNICGKLFPDQQKISLQDWLHIKQIMAPWLRWSASNPAPEFDTMRDSLRRYIEDNSQAALLALIDQDNAEAATWNSMKDLERLVRYQRDLYHLATNFVNFKGFYEDGSSAIFQAGTLYIDQRSCNLCIRINDVGKHSGMAALAGTCLVYCECRRKAGAEKIIIVAAITNGDSENIMIGRNGLFYDREGRDWDATVVKIIDNPISIRQAFWLPYKGFVRMVEDQVAKRAMNAEAQTSGKLTELAELAANVDKKQPTAKNAPLPVKVDVGTVAALGVAAGAIGTFVATLFGYLAGIVRLGPLAIAGAAVGVIALISGPSIILAVIKLRKRNLGPILDAGGWAINAKARINVPFGEMLTKLPVLPKGSKRSRLDPFAERKSPWLRIVVTALLIYGCFTVLDSLGFVYEWTGGRVGERKSVPIKVKESVLPK